MKAHYLIYTLLAVLTAGCSPSPHTADKETAERPVIFPDYTEVTFPINIAPPNFLIREEGKAYQTEIGLEGEPAALCLQSGEPTVRIPEGKWKELLEKAAGQEVYFRISIRQGKEWVRYADIVNRISPYPIDGYLAYRLLYPGYELWNEMGIYQRELSSYRQTAIAENRNFGKQCVNCHTFNAQSPETMMMHIRGPKGGTLIRRNGKTAKVNPKGKGFKYGPTYSSWHPSGRYIAFSTNEIQQFFHSAGTKAIEVSDLGADLMIYDVEEHRSFTDSLVYGDAYMETFPAWTPDGQTLYFSRAKGYRKGMALDSIRYDLCRVGFDAATGRLGAPEVVYEASALGKSVSFPCVSPDGKYLMFTESAYGNFSIWHPESDLCLLDLGTGDVRKLEEVNSEDVDSYHTWSSSGRWFVFSSKRMDGLWARPYLAAFDPETGRAGKPFVLPQEDPTFYDQYTYTFNRPELITAPVERTEELEMRAGE